MAAKAALAEERARGARGRGDVEEYREEGGGPTREEESSNLAVVEMGEASHREGNNSPAKLVPSEQVEAELEKGIQEVSVRTRVRAHITGTDPSTTEILQRDVERLSTNRDTEKVLSPSDHPANMRRLRSMRKRRTNTMDRTRPLYNISEEKALLAKLKTECKGLEERCATP